MNWLSRRDPWREMMSMRNAMDRVFDNMLLGSQSDWQPAVWDLAMDVSETDDEFLVKASIPGVKPEDLDISYNNNTLTIKGEVKEEREEGEESRYHLRERRYGQFARSISLPSTVDADEIEANYDAGVLTLHLPKAEAAKPRRISVRSNESPQLVEGKATDIKHKN